MRETKRIAFAGVFTAILICCQFALSGIQGVEITSAFLLCFCFYFGAVLGLFVATAFSILRCLIFGFTPSVIILYLVYYNLFALLFGLLGKKLKNKSNLYVYSLLTILAIVCTVFFTLLDDIITPLFYGLSSKEMYAYFIASLPVMLPHCICVGITVPLLAPPLLKTFSLFNLKN